MRQLQNQKGAKEVQNFQYHPYTEFIKWKYL